MKVCIDIECNSLNNPSKIWVIVCKDVCTGVTTIFREVHDGEQEKKRFLEYASKVRCWIGHNIIEYDLPILSRITGLPFPNTDDVCDTLILSRLVDYSREGGHSLEQYGTEFGLEKGKFNDWTHWSQEMEDYCVRDVDITHKVYHKYLSITEDPAWAPSIKLENRFQLIVNDLHNNGFCFNKVKAEKLLEKVKKELGELDKAILEGFPPREIVVRTFTPKATKFGTISKSSVPVSLRARIHEFEVGKEYNLSKEQVFNPSSHKQLIEVLNEAGWKPEDKTSTHVDCEREINRGKKTGVDPALHIRLEGFKKTGWKVNETNLGTLPDSAPESARLLAKRILLEARRRSLVEWLGLVGEDGRIHGKFVGLGAWTHRMAHQRPNTANIPTAVQMDGSVKLLGKELRELWCAPRNRLLVGVDAEGIQLRIFAHYINDEEFTDALVRGSKADKTDPHSLNQRILGSVCKTRQAAKRFVYALLLGGGLGKLAQILECSQSETKEALDRLLERYTGFAALRKGGIPSAARKGGFTGLDGRFVPLPGETQRDREHLCMSGFLQSGEAIVIKRAAIIIDDALHEEKELKKWMFVNLVHDELQSEVRNDMGLALKVAKIKAEAIKQAGVELGLKCPLAGSYWNDDNKQYTIGKDWYCTH